MDEVFPSVVFFGKPAEVFIKLHGEPRPNSSHLEALYVNGPRELSVSEAVYTVTPNDMALLTYVYVFEVPEAEASNAENGVLDFSLTLDRNHPNCNPEPVTQSGIPVTKASGK